MNVKESEEEAEATVVEHKQKQTKKIIPSLYMDYFFTISHLILTTHDKSGEGALSHPTHEEVGARSRGPERLKEHIWKTTPLPLLTPDTG